YWVADYYDVEPRLGDLAGYRELVKKAHANGIKIIKDVVFNHTASNHIWVKDPPAPDWYNGSVENHLNLKDFNFAALLDPHANQKARQVLLEGWFNGELPDLRQENAHLRRYLIQNILWWIAETGIDGIRLDAYPYVPRSFWSELQKELRAEFPEV